MEHSVHKVGLNIHLEVKEEADKINRGRFIASRGIIPSL